MRLYHIYLSALALFAFAACRKLSLDAINFGVNADSTSYQPGSPTTFTLYGNPDNITFFSGERGHRYQYRSRVSALGTPVLQFSSALNSGVQPNSLHLMISANFKGVAAGDTVTTVSNIGAAGWTDITSRAVLGTGTTATASGAVNLSDYADSGSSVYIAFRYLAVSGSIQDKWTITGLTVTNTLPDASVYTIANLVANNTPITSNYGGATTFSPGWVTFPVSNTYPWTVTAGTSLVIAGAATAAAATANAESWVIMGPLNLQKVTPDMGVAIKTMTAALPSYVYTYAAPGTYAAIFVASNYNVDRSDSINRSINIVIQ